MPTHPRLLLACAIVLPLAVAGAGCGASGSSSAPVRSSIAAAMHERDGDGDNDSFGMGSADTDRDAVLTDGPAAGPADRQAIVSLIRRYYAAAAAENGAKACTLTYSLFAESLVEEHDRGKGAPSLSGDTCRQIASKLFAQQHAQLVRDLATLRVTTVQLRLKQGRAVVRFGVANEYLVQVQRLRDGGWAMNMLPYEAAL